MHLDALMAGARTPAAATADTATGTGLVLMGGGARTAYQAGALQAIGELLAGRGERQFPFRVMVGTSAGALNATFLASRARQGLPALAALAGFWQTIRSEAVYRLPDTPLARWSRWATALGLVLSARQQGAALDSLALVHTLHQAIDLAAIDQALQAGVLQALAVTASSYSSGEHWTFCQTRDQQPLAWSRPGRRAEQQPITIDHLMASSAIPFIFPATALWVDGRKDFFGDGSMRQMSPLAPAVHLGARRVLAIGVGQPRRASLGGSSGDGAVPGAIATPSLGGIAGHAMASVFHDTLMADVEQIERVNRALDSLPAPVLAQLPFRPVPVLVLMPWRSAMSTACRRRSCVCCAVLVRSAVRGRRWPATCSSSPVSCRP